MRKGFSVHVGVNRVNAAGISVPNLKGCANDAIAMHEIALAMGFTSEGPILDEQAKFDRVIDAILRAAKTEVVNERDIFLFTFAGHGSRRGTNDISESDGKDEALVLHDGILIDNVIRRLLWPKFNPGVRILAISDSCYSGSSLVSLLFGPAPPPVALFPDPGPINALNANVALSPFPVGAPGAKPKKKIAKPQFRTIPEDQKKEHFNLLKDFYKELRDQTPTGPTPSLAASLLTLSACRDDEKTADGDHGVFTQALLKVWNSGSFGGNYDDFKKEIQQNLPKQTPELLPEDADPAFIAERPFTI